MKYRIALWAGVGFIVAGCWAVYAALSSPPALTFGDPIMPLVELTCPVVLASIRLHFGVSLYWTLLANAMTYAVVGLIVETLRQRVRRGH
jgi:hypothetical protein